MNKPMMPNGALAAMLFYCSSAGLALTEPQPSRPAPARLRGVITEAGTGLPTPCTVAITDATGKLVLEQKSFQSGFRSTGRFDKLLPPGHTAVGVSRGLETPTVSKELDLKPGTDTLVEFVLQRRVDLRARGWYAGDSHAHMIHGEKTIPVDFDFVALTAQAEDLQYLSLSHVWQLDRPTPESLEAQLTPRSRPTCVLTWNLEEPKNYYRGDAGRCLGHCWCLGVRGRTPEGRNVIPLLLDASAWDYEVAKPTFANFESHALIHSQGGAAFYTHPARWWMGAWGGQGGYPKQERMRVSNMAVELPLDTLVGPTFDGLDVLTGDGEFEANAAAFDLWALLLNHGYRLTPTASSDACFDRPGGAVPGTARTYSFLKDGFSLPAVTRATAQGKVFATTGPLLLVSLDQQPPGSSLLADGKAHTLAIEAWASGKDPKGLTRIEILKNGKPFEQFALPALAAFQTNVQLHAAPSDWYCVRAFGGDPRRQRAITGAFFFDSSSYQPPAPVRPLVHVRIRDARSGQPLPATLTEVTFLGPLPKEGLRHTVENGEGTLQVRGTVRLRADVPGYRSTTLSPFLDQPALIKYLTGLEGGDLVKWETFERIRELLARVDLDFPLERP